jgi:pentatricopeptide repeat protein
MNERLILSSLGYLKNNRPEQVIDLSFKLDDQMDEINLLVFFSACAELGNENGLKIGKQIFTRLSQQSKGEQLHQKVLHAVLNMFTKCSDIENAEKLFIQLNKNSISYGCMMTMYNTQNEPEKTLSLYEQMKRDKIEADYLIWVLIINALSELSDLSTCELITSELPNQFFDNSQIQNALINMWVSDKIDHFHKRINGTL